MDMTPQTRLKRSQARTAQLERMADDPRLSPTQRRIVRHLITSQRAAVRLRVRAVAHAAMAERG
jgi:predicted transcriptional regulator